MKKIGIWIIYVAMAYMFFWYFMFLRNLMCHSYGMEYSLLVNQCVVKEKNNVGN